MAKITEIGQKLRKLRKAAGHTQESLEGVSGVSRRTIQDIERGLNSPSVSTMEAIAAALGVAVSDFFSDGEKPAPEPISGKDMIKAAVREALAEGPLPMKFEHPDALERLRQENADLKTKVSELENKLRPFANLPASLIEALGTANAYALKLAERAIRVEPPAKAKKSKASS